MTAVVVVVSGEQRRHLRTRSRKCVCLWERLNATEDRKEEYSGSGREEKRRRTHAHDGDERARAVRVRAKGNRRLG